MYLIAIVVANIAIFIIGPSATFFVALLLIGLNITARDKLHEEWKNNGLIWKMLLLFLSGSIITILINFGAIRIAIASSVAFAISATLDTLIYHLLINKPYFTKVNGSNIGSAISDSLIFPIIAFPQMPLLQILLLISIPQAIAKMIGGFIWSLILNTINKKK